MDGNQVQEAARNMGRFKKYCPGRFGLSRDISANMVAWNAFIFYKSYVNMCKFD